MRASSVEVTAGGKGVNVARVLRGYGLHPAIVGFVAADDREQLLGLLDREGATVVPVDVPGRVRQAIVMIEQAAGRVTVVNEPGGAVVPETWDRYVRAVEDRLTGQAVLVCAGSLPPGVPAGGYGELVQAARRAGVFTILDTAPQALRAALGSQPDLVTPNLEEAEAVLDDAVGDVLTTAVTDVRQRSERAALALCRAGAVRAAVTAGAHGVALARGETLSWVPATPVEVVSAVGAGDSFVGGVVLGLLANGLLAIGLLAIGQAVDGLAGDRDRSSGGSDAGSAEHAESAEHASQLWTRVMVRGVATASASCEQLRAGGTDPARVLRLVELIEQELAA
jgi:1-phosphofructokinase family hexose kinase